MPTDLRVYTAWTSFLFNWPRACSFLCLAFRDEQARALLKYEIINALHIRSDHLPISRPKTTWSLQWRRCVHKVVLFTSVCVLLFCDACVCVCVCVCVLPFLGNLSIFVASPSENYYTQSCYYVLVSKSIYFLHCCHCMSHNQWKLLCSEQTNATFKNMGVIQITLSPGVSQRVFFFIRPTLTYIGNNASLFYTVHPCLLGSGLLGILQFRVRLAY